MNIEKVTYKIIKDTIQECTGKLGHQTSEFILKMMISHLTDEQKGVIMDEIVNERDHILFKKGDIILFDPINNKYDLKDLYEDDIMKDALLMTNEGYIKGTIIDDTNYQDICSPYAIEYKVKINFSTVRTGADIHVDTDSANKEIRVKRSNIIRLWNAVKDLE